MRNLTEGKHFRISVPKDRPVRIGDRVYGWDSCCVVVKIVEHKKEEGKILFYILRRWTDNKWVYKKANRVDFFMCSNRHNVVLLKSDDQVYKIYKIIKGKAKQKHSELRGTHPKGVIFSEYAAPQDLSTNVLRSIS